MSKKVSEIILEKLLEKIKSGNILPWQKPNFGVCQNYVTGIPYSGINRWLLDGGEYITVKQLTDYNKANKTNYWFAKGTPYDLVVYYGPSLRDLTETEKKKYEEGTMCESSLKNIVLKGDEPKMRKFILRYYTVYNITYIKDKDGKQLPSKVATTEVAKQSDMNAEEFIAEYCEGSGVHFVNTSGEVAFYTELKDTANVPQKGLFNTLDEYYLTAFHELIHSTGVQERMNRECFKKYGTSKERSKEELIAEVGSMLLCSELGVVKEEVENSLNYVAGWVKWMKENPDEVVMGMQQAENAVKYMKEVVEKVKVAKKIA